MALSKRGIDKLEKVMLANGKYFYDQFTFARVADCGTELCAAGFSRLITVGEDQFNKEVVRHDKCFSRPFIHKCMKDGKNLLGVKARKNMVAIFDYPKHWPADIRKKFESMKTPRGEINIYIKMLRTRVNDDGSIREKGE